MTGKSPVKIIYDYDPLCQVSTYAQGLFTHGRHIHDVDLYTMSIYARCRLMHDVDLYTCMCSNEDRHCKIVVQTDLFRLLQQLINLDGA